jgi:P4 family phage/plasmid primase-like protien
MDIELTSGHSASHSNSNGELSSIAFNDIIKLAHNPDNVEKTQAQWFMASILKTRTLKDQKSDGQFAVIWGDIDKSPPTIDDLCHRLDDILGGSDYVAYTTKSATSDTQNSRVIVPLIRLLSFEDWHRAQLAFNNALEDSGVTVDRCSEKANQIAFLPNRGAYYDYRIKSSGNYFEPLTKDTVQADDRTPVDISYANNLNGHQCPSDTLIYAFNAQNSINEILIQAGYAQKGSLFRHPNSRSGSYSASVKGGRVHSLSTADPLYTEGGGVGAHDAFSAFNVLFHNGDQKIALYDAGENWVKIKGQSWNVQKNIEALASLEDPFQILAEDASNKQAIQNALLKINSADVLDKGNLRNQLKRLTGLSLADIKSACKEAQNVQLSHIEIAEQFLLMSEYKNLVACEGALWQCDHQTKIWKKISLKKIGQQIANCYKSQKLCRRASDYKALSDLVYDHIEKPSFFEGAPKGIATSNYFYSVFEGKVIKTKLNSSHLARFQVSVEPSDYEPTKLLKTLREAFHPDDADEQIRQLRMFTGLAVFNIQHSLDRALLLYGIGGSFKSGFQRIIESLVRKEYLSSVSPLEWDQDYKKAELVGKLINLVPEINNDKVIPGAEFKSVVSCDRISAREAYGKVFTFRPGCAHWFNSNFYLATRDQSDGFWRRWAIVHFSVSKPELERDPNLADTIIKTELPMILNWALQGVTDYLENQIFLSKAHYKCVAEWQRESNSVRGWVSDPDCSGMIDERKTKHAIKVTEAYDQYGHWCTNNGVRNKVSSKVFKARMADLGYNIVIRDGYSCYELLWGTNDDDFLK